MALENGGVEKWLHLMKAMMKSSITPHFPKLQWPRLRRFMPTRGPEDKVLDEVGGEPNLETQGK